MSSGRPVAPGIPGGECHLRPTPVSPFQAAPFLPSVISLAISSKEVHLDQQQTPHSELYYFLS